MSAELSLAEALQLSNGKVAYISPPWWDGGHGLVRWVQVRFEDGWEPLYFRLSDWEIAGGMNATEGGQKLVNVRPRNFIRKREFEAQYGSPGS